MPLVWSGYFGSEGALDLITLPCVNADGVGEDWAWSGVGMVQWFPHKRLFQAPCLRACGVAIRLATACQIATHYLAARRTAQHWTPQQFSQRVDTAVGETEG